MVEIGKHKSSQPDEHRVSSLGPVSHRAPPRRVEASDVFFRVGGTIGMHVIFILLWRMAANQINTSWVSWALVLFAFIASLLTAVGACLTARSFYRDRWFK